MILCSKSGHGGFKTAEYLKNNLFNNLRSHPDFIKDTKSAIGMNFKILCMANDIYGIEKKLKWSYLFVAVESFRQTDTDYLNKEKGQQKDAGSTASTAVLVRDKIFVANVGDSRVVASRAGSGLMIILLFILSFLLFSLME